MVAAGSDLAVVVFVTVAVVFATTAVSIALSKSKVFQPTRFWLEDRSRWLGDLINCWFCTSHYVALAFAILWHPIQLMRWEPGNVIFQMFVTVGASAVITNHIVGASSYGYTEGDDE